MAFIIFKSNSTWICPMGITTVFLYGCGGGGGGGGGGRPPHNSPTSIRGGSGGGGGGASANFVMVAVVPGTSYTVTIGTGGTGIAGATADNSNGAAGVSANNGSDTTFGSLATFAGASAGISGFGSPASGVGVGGATVRTMPNSYNTNATLTTVITWGPGSGSSGGNNLLSSGGYLATAGNPAIGNPNQAAAPSPTYGTDSTGVGGYSGGSGGSSVFSVGGVGGVGGAGSPTTGSVGSGGGNGASGSGGGGGGAGGNGSTASGNGGTGGTGGNGILYLAYVS